MDVDVQPQVWVGPGPQNKSRCDQHAYSDEVLHWNPLECGNHTSVLGKTKDDDWSGRAKARSGLRMMPTFPLPSLKFRTAGFPQYGFKAGRSDRAFPFYASSRRTVCHCPSCSPLPSSDPRSVPGDVARWSTSVRAVAAALPQGPSLRSGLFCPVPSTLAAPSAPLAGTSRFHRFAAYTKCLRCAHCA